MSQNLLEKCDRLEGEQRTTNTTLLWLATEWVVHRVNQWFRVDLASSRLKWRLTNRLTQTIGRLWANLHCRLFRRALGDNGKGVLAT